MQEAIRKFIDDERKKQVPLEVIELDIQRVARSEIKVARQKQLRLWRKLRKGL